jgi:hypothetical protein
VDWVHAPPLTAAPAIRAVRLTAARGRYGRSRTRRRNLLLNRTLRAGRTAIKNRKNCACCHILLGPTAVNNNHPAWMESAMSTINWDLRNLTVQTHSGLRWTDIKRQLSGWRHLEGLDDRGLEDIGISCGTSATPHFISRSGE